MIRLMEGSRVLGDALMSTGMMMRMRRRMRMRTVGTMWKNEDVSDDEAHCSPSFVDRAIQSTSWDNLQTRRPGR
jgi:hypothetical protein